MAQQMTALEFSYVARSIGNLARRLGYDPPAFQARSGSTVHRTIRRFDDGTATVTVPLSDRPSAAVIDDLIDGVIAAHQLDPINARRLRDALWPAAQAAVCAKPPSTVRHGRFGVDRHHDDLAIAA